MASQIFSIVNLLAMAGWALLLMFPRKRWAELVSGRVLPALLSAAYVVIVAAVWGTTPGGFSSLEAVSQLFDSQWMLLGGWIHYLAFDLFVGSWLARDAHERGIAHVWVVPLLLATFMFGPAGLLAYLGLRAVVSAARRRGGAATALPRPGHAGS
ncbi:MAG: ABA4-like family protein [Polyangiaceae bacterium]